MLHQHEKVITTPCSPLLSAGGTARAREEGKNETREPFRLLLTRERCGGRNIDRRDEAGADQVPCLFMVAASAKWGRRERKTILVLVGRGHPRQAGAELLQGGAAR